jgi:hypothetical protein
MSDTFDVSRPEYNAILRHAVTEIRNARSLVAQQLTSATNSVYWSLGKLLSEKQVVGGLW